MKDGKGKEEFVNGMVFEGIYENGLKQKDGWIIFPDGSSYKGHFKDDKMEVTSNQGGLRSLQMEGRGRREGPS